MSLPGTHTAWRLKPSASLSPKQKHWLMRDGALTAGLRSLGGALNLRVLNEYSCGLNRDEAQCLRLPLKAPVWVREVVMSIDGVDCIVARSLAPLIASHGVWRGMRTLSSRPLADILYHQRGIVRSGFEVARLSRALPLMRTADYVLGKPMHRIKNQSLLARRSVFWKDGYPLLVAECFLPAFWLKIAEG